LALHPRTDGFLSLTDDWAWGLTINFLAAVRTTRAALTHLLERGASTIVSTCSVNTILPDPLIIDYSAAKATLLNFSKSLSKEVGPRGVRVNTSVRGRSPRRCGSAMTASPLRSLVPATGRPSMSQNGPPLNW
jgi:NAD(P)-dependent dehydrogenase (short-subunit alcohol dehydrogenase family)